MAARPASGAVATTQPLSSYGFGADKWLLVIDLSEIGSVDEIDLKDKEHATMQVWKGGAKLGTPYDIGIEIKGRRDRLKLNYGLELWKPDGTDAATGKVEYEDDEADLVSPKRFRADINQGRLCAGDGASAPCLPLPISGVGLFDGVYLDSKLRIGQNLNGGGARIVQVRVD